MDDKRNNRKNYQVSLKIFIGADHRGYSLKRKIIKGLTQQGYTAIDIGTHAKDIDVDYPHYSYQVGKKVVGNKGSRGILVCMTGIGHSIAANKISGVRAALCYNKQAARLSRAHNDSNILIVGSKFVSQKEIMAIIQTWLKTPFDGGRHARRLKQIGLIEKKICRKER